MITPREKCWHKKKEAWGKNIWEGPWGKFTPRRRSKKGGNEENKKKKVRTSEPEGTRGQSRQRPRPNTAFRKGKGVVVTEVTKAVGGTEYRRGTVSPLGGGQSGRR